jgi:hypothetical protein
VQKAKDMKLKAGKVTAKSSKDYSLAAEGTEFVAANVS